MKLSRLTYLAFSGIGLLGLAGACRADVFIDPNSSSSGLNSALYGPIGQSFTADASNITWIGMFTSICGCEGDGYAPVEFQMDLLDGSGLSGPVAATETTIAPWGLYGFLYFNFTGTSLVVGDTYTAVLSQVTPNPPPMGGGGALVYGTNNGGDTGGEAFWSDPYSIGPPQPQPGSDFYLRVCTEQNPCQPVPEPSSDVAVTVGMLGLFAVKRLVG